MSGNKNNIIGGSFSNPVFIRALNFFGILGEVQRTRNKYEKIAQMLVINPTRPNSNIRLKTNSPAYKTFIENEVIRRFTAQQAVLEREKERQAKKTKKSALALLAKRPKITDRRIIDRHGGFTLYNYELESINNLEELYDIIKKELDRLGDLNFITLMFENLNTGKVRGMSIKADYLQDYQDFSDRVDAMINGEVAGSDAFSEDEFRLLFSNIHISTYSLARAFGKSDNQLFNIMEIEEIYKNECVLNCLNHLGYNVKPKDKLNLHYVNELVKYLTDNDIPISILSNSFFLTDKQQNIVVKNGMTKIEVENKKKKRKDLKCVSPITLDDIELCYVYEPAYYTATLLYDEVNKHMDIILNEPTLRDDVFLSVSGEVLREGKVIFTPKQILTNTTKKTRGGFRYMLFDYETIIDFNRSCCMKPYSLSVLDLGEDELIALEKADLNKDIEEVQRIRKTFCKTFLGYDCNDKFIEWFLKIQLNYTYCFVGYNNANFDNFILLDGLLRYNQHDNRVCYNVNNVFYNGSQLLNFTINGRHTMFDIHKHLCFGSLSDNCRSFKINCCSKKSFDHSLAQRLHENNELIDFINNNEELKEYNEFDVLATAVLFQKYRKALTEIPCVKKYAKNIKETTTIGSLIYKVFKEHTKNKEIKFGKLNYNYYKDLQKHKIAGRVELFNGVQKIEERMASTDVCSLYPYVMSIHNCYYPCGDIIDAPNYMGDDVMGFYYCDIDQSNLRDMNLPKIYAEKKELENDWGHDAILNNYLISNVMIGLLKKYGCGVVIKNGFVFNDKKKSCDMFSFLLDLMKAKNEQDGFKSKNDDRYNPALRETEKLLMNALSGKVIEGLHTEKTIDFDNDAQFLKIQEKAKSVNFINCIGTKLFATYEIDEESICEAQQRPIFLGVLIYDYAKRYMFENSYSKIGLNNLFYTDTDASKFKYSQMERWSNWIREENVIVPHWAEVEEYDERYKTHLIYEPNSKVFGSFEDELEEMVGDHYLFYCLEKKSWSYSIHKNGEWKSKFKFKGINPKAIMADIPALLGAENPIIYEKVINGKNGERREIKMMPESDYEVYEWCEANKHLSISNDVIGFYDKIYTEGSAYVFVNSFRRIVKNSLHKVEMGDEDKYNGLMNSIQVNYTLKRVRIKK